MEIILLRSFCMILTPGRNCVNFRLSK